MITCREKSQIARNGSSTLAYLIVKDQKPHGSGSLVQSRASASRGMTVAITESHPATRRNEMKSKRLPGFILQSGSVCIVLASVTVRADVEYFIQDEAGWQAAAGAHSTINSLEFPDGTWIDTEYQYLGVQFGGDGNIIRCCSDHIYPLDSAGLDGNSLVTFTFDQPMHAIAVHTNSHIEFDLYFKGKLIEDCETIFVFELGVFGGIISDQPFDYVEIPQAFPGAQVHLDNLYFGPPVCQPDLDQDGVVEFDDFVLLLAHWGVCEPGMNGAGGCNADLDADGDIDFDDFTLLLAAWGSCF